LLVSHNALAVQVALEQEEIRVPSASAALPSLSCPLAAMDARQERFRTLIWLGEAPTLSPRIRDLYRSRLAAGMSAVPLQMA